MAITGRFAIIGYILLPDFKNGGSLNSDWWATFLETINKSQYVTQPTHCLWKVT